jgi:putative selenate reductase
MPAKFNTVSLSHLLKLILHELDSKGSIFGIPEEMFHVVRDNESLKTKIFGHPLHTPLGAAAGPHTQIAQNIVAAWLTGARYIELKTVQTLDELEIPKPCIDMQDEGYNCEWSQELSIRESFNEYLNAWIIIHVLSHRMGWGTDPGAVFNMSVGYDMKGIMQDNVQWFLDKMSDCTDELAEKIQEIIMLYPEVSAIMISHRISDNITLSTMHGCPPDEIEQIAAYLLSVRHLHTLVKLNPTLLGPQRLRDILNNILRFKTVVPDEAFTHDLKYDDAVRIIRSLQAIADRNKLHFGLKLTNTLESRNNKTIFGSDVPMMYMSGRALHPLAVNLAHILQQEFGGGLLLSFSAGVNAFNISKLIACGFTTVTVCSDLLKPGGYMRLSQYFEQLDEAFSIRGAHDIDSFIISSADSKDHAAAALLNLARYSDEVLCSADYTRDYIRPPDIKSSRELGYFDCISAPCRNICAAAQDIPDYLWFTSRGLFDKAFEVILRTNPFPSVTGLICDHLCQTKCTRINYDDALHVREVKRFISEQDEVTLTPAVYNGMRTAIIGAGPAGLSCAYYLRMAGFVVDMFEARQKAGGMVQHAIPGFRMTDEAVARDVKRITDLGVNIIYDTRVDIEKYRSLKREYNYIFIGSGAQLPAPIDIAGADVPGVIEPLQFLYRAREGAETGIGSNVVIIGGGNTAMDAARTALRLTGEKGKVTIVYRRTVNEMPADQEEIKAVMEEGIEIIELAAPERILYDKDRVTGLLCRKIELKGADKTGRPAPVKSDDPPFEITCDTIIPAIGQLVDIDFADDKELTVEKNDYRTRLEKVYIGGDAMRGASTAINAIGDGRRAAEQIITDAGISFDITLPATERDLSAKELVIRRARRVRAAPQLVQPAEQGRLSSSVGRAPDRNTIIHEAERCLWCDEMCSICTTVCPNLANRCYEMTPCSYVLQKAVCTEDGIISYIDDGFFEVRQKYQIINIADLCNECGNCSTFCPTAGAPYKDKPRFFMTAKAFNQAQEGYHLAIVDDRKNLIYKKDDHYLFLTERPDKYIFEDDYVTASFSKTDFRMSDVRFRTPCISEAHFRRAAEMVVLLKGAESLLYV